VVKVVDVGEFASEVAVGSGWTPAHTRSASPGKCPANGVTAGSFLACTPYPVCAG
jgi:hypothetical protein